MRLLLLRSASYVDIATIFRTLSSPLVGSGDTHPAYGAGVFGDKSHARIADGVIKFILIGSVFKYFEGTASVHRGSNSSGCERVLFENVEFTHFFSQGNLEWSPIDGVACRKRLRKPSRRIESKNGSHDETAFLEESNGAHGLGATGKRGFPSSTRSRCAHRISA